jgi:CubicO group peptidase (beta-lactamase class C family)
MGEPTAVRTLNMDWQKVAVTASKTVTDWSEGRNPGGAIIAFDAHDIRVEAYGGLANLSTGSPFDDKTALRFASITKHLTAAAALAAQDQNEIDLDSPFAVCIDDVSSAVGNVQLIRAMDMTGGLPDILDTAWLLGSSRSGVLEPAALGQFGRSFSKLNFVPGTEFSYSNTGYALVEAALAQRGQPLAPLLRQHFFNPLNLVLDLAVDQSEPVPHLAPGYWRSPDGWRLGLFGAPYSGADGLVGTPLDLAKWLRALLAGDGPGRGILRRLSAPRHLANGRTIDFGFGVTKFQLGETSLLGFGGQLPGYTSQFLLHPDMRCGVLVASNREDGNSAALAHQLMAELLSQPLPRVVTNELPEGLFATEDGPFWLTYLAGQLGYMGAAGMAFFNEHAGVVTGGPYIPMQLEATDNAIVGEVGYVGRHFARVPTNVRADRAWAGSWENWESGSVFRIEVSGGEAEIARGVGACRARYKLKPIGNGRALFQHREGPRTQHVCLELTPGGTMRLNTHRSRVAEYVRTNASVG